MKRRAKRRKEVGGKEKFGGSGAEPCTKRDTRREDAGCFSAFAEGEGARIDEGGDRAERGARSRERKEEKKVPVGLSFEGKWRNEGMERGGNFPFLSEGRRGRWSKAGGLSIVSSDFRGACTEMECSGHTAKISSREGTVYIIM